MIIHYMTGRFSKRFRAGTKLPRSWRKVCTLTPSRRLSRCLFGALFLPLVLSGCATTRYVTVPCITKDQQLPAEPPKIHDKLTGEADKDIRTVAGSNIRLRAWGEGLLGILEGCRG